ncbi:hypothetical protein BDW74DRAFT_139189 [Aspergillus multicolor]|uniref:uncharacterized protein n=1 Tax=Aspergillus multicolor TaxID=41759 RepID=UPI003CCD1EA2
MAAKRHALSTCPLMMGLFGCAIVDKPGGVLKSKFFSKHGRIEHHFISVGLVNVVYIQVKRELCSGKARLDVVAQILAECAACDFVSRQTGAWTPVLALLCNVNYFNLFVLDSADGAAYCSGWKPGIPTSLRNKDAFFVLLKQTTERLLDWFIMAYINAIRETSYRDKHKKG